VRVNSTARATQYGNSLWEVEVFAALDTSCAGPLPLAATSATSSGNESASFGPNNARDSNTGTRWSSAFSDPQWIYLDLGATYNVKRVVLDWENAYSTQFDIQVSSNATSWTTIFTNNAGNGGVDNITNLTGSGRYVRMLGRARNTQYGHSLWEFQVYGTP
jgi:hypothetical protein